MDMLNYETIQLFMSAFSLATVTALLIGIRQAIKHLPIDGDQKLRAKRTATYGCTLALGIFLVVIWAEELREAALVLSAFAVAIVLSTKELIMCVTGWWLKLAGGHFRVGDRIRIGSFNGDVVDYGLLTISLLEVDPNSPRQLRSGSILTIPNSMLLSHAVINQTLAFSFRWHSVLVRISDKTDWQRAEDALLEAGEEVWKDFEEDAEEEFVKFADRFGFQPGTKNPKIFMSHDDTGSKTLELRIGLPVRDGHHVEDRVLRAYYSKLSVQASNN